MAGLVFVRGFACVMFVYPNCLRWRGAVLSEGIVVEALAKICAVYQLLKSTTYFRHLPDPNNVTHGACVLNQNENGMVSLVGTHMSRIGGRRGTRARGVSQVITNQLTFCDSLDKLTMRSS